jgi:hypothetical protein
MTADFETASIHDAVHHRGYNSGTVKSSTVGAKARLGEGGEFPRAVKCSTGRQRFHLLAWKMFATM